MVEFNLAEIEIFVYGTVATVIISCVVEHVLTWHQSKMLTIQKRSDDFIKLSEKYYLPLAHRVYTIELEINPTPKGKIRPKMLFFKLAEYLTLYYDFVDEGCFRYIFPKETQQEKVEAYGNYFYDVVTRLIFKDDSEAIHQIIERHKTQKNYSCFIRNIEKFQAYNEFTSTIKNEQILGLLSNTANLFKNSIEDGISEEYKAWTKFEIDKKQKSKEIKSYRKEMDRLIESLLPNELEENKYG